MNISEEDARKSVRKIYYEDEIRKNRNRMIILAAIAVIVVAAYMLVSSMN